MNAWASAFDETLEGDVAKLVFLSYAPEDIAHREALDKHLGSLRRAGIVDVWHDGEVPVGGDRAALSAQKLEAAALVLLLVSADYLVSEACRAEMDRALKRSETGHAQVVPVLVRPCERDQERIAALRSLPSDGRPVSVWSDTDSAWADVADGVEALVGVEAMPPGKPSRASGAIVAILCGGALAAAIVVYAFTREGPARGNPLHASTAVPVSAPVVLEVPSASGGTLAVPSGVPTAAPGGTTAASSSTARDCPSEMATIVAEGPMWIGTRVTGGKVTLAPYCIDRTEVTVTAFAKCVGAGKCTSSSSAERCNAGTRDRQDHPMNCVSWTEASAYCEWAGRRLPTVEEWEFAARGPDERKYPWGSQEPSDQACWNGSGNDAGWRTRTSTCPVAKYEAGNSPFGLSDMAGNVSEWTASLFRSDQPRGKRAIRGGSWQDAGSALLESVRSTYDVPDARHAGVGFRCAKDLR